MLDYSKFSFLSTIAVMQYIFHMFICIMVYWECRNKGGSNFHLALFLARITSEQSMFSNLLEKTLKTWSCLKILNAFRKSTDL